MPPTIDPRVDAYITKKSPDAQKILQHVRKLVHRACPKVEETIKWGAPAFNYMGALANMAAFKQHCAFGFWKADLMKNHKTFSANQKESMGHLGKITQLKDLPSDSIFIAYVKEAMALNENGVKLPAKPVAAAMIPPDDFMQALKKNKKALSVFEQFAPSHRKAYIEWIVEAKQETTRTKRINQAVEMIAEGKGKNWKYETKK